MQKSKLQFINALKCNCTLQQNFHLIQPHLSKLITKFCLYTKYIYLFIYVCMKMFVEINVCCSLVPFVLPLVFTEARKETWETPTVPSQSSSYFLLYISTYRKARVCMAKGEKTLLSTTYTYTILFNTKGPLLDMCVPLKLF